jgi:hypothetical protein
MRPPVPCLGRSNSELRFASQSHKSCTTTPPACSARRNTYQSRSASLDIRCLPCLLIWHSKALICTDGPVIVGRERHDRRQLDVIGQGGCRPRCQPGASTPSGMVQTAAGDWVPSNISILQLAQPWAADFAAKTCTRRSASPMLWDVRSHRSAGCDDPRHLRTARRIVSCRGAAPAVSRHHGQCAGGRMRADDCRLADAAQAATTGESASRQG